MEAFLCEMGQGHRTGGDLLSQLTVCMRFTKVFLGRIQVEEYSCKSTAVRVQVEEYRWKSTGQAGVFDLTWRTGSARGEGQQSF